jgi:hypothetical protein
MSLLPNAATHSSLDIFQKPPVLVNFEQGNVQETFPTTGIDAPTIEFELSTDRNVFLDMQEIFLKVALKVFDPKNPEAEYQPDQHAFVNNTLHSLFSNCEVSLNGEVVSNSNNLYPHKAFITTEWSHTGGCKDSLLLCQGYEYESDPADFDAIREQKVIDGVGKQTIYYFYGKLAVDFFNCEKLLLPKSKLRIKLIKNSPSFVFLNLGPKKEDDAAKDISMKFIKASIFSRQMIVSETVYASIEKALLKSPARYTFTDTDTKTFIIPSGQNIFVRENIFNTKPIRSMAVAMNTNKGFSKSDMKLNPFHYQKFGLNKVIIYRNGVMLYNIDVETSISGNVQIYGVMLYNIDVETSISGNVQIYHTTLRSLHFNHDGPDIPLEDYPDHFVMVFDLTSTNESHSEVYYPELTGGSLRLELSFREPLDEAVEVLVLGETLSTVYVKSTGEVYKDG